MRDTVAIETLATAATARMSGSFPAALLAEFRGTNSSYCKEWAIAQKNNVSFPLEESDLLAHGVRALSQLIDQGLEVV